MNNIKVWEAVPITTETKLVGTTLVFETKLNEHNEILEYKAGTFMCFWIFTNHSLKFEQLDIKSTFLDGPLEEEVFPAIPHSLDLNKTKVCLQLKKGIHGLCQAPHEWYNWLSTWLEIVGFKEAISEPGVFHCKLKSPIWLFILVDDIAMFGKDLIKDKHKIQRESKTKFLGQEDLVLGIKIHQDNNSIDLLQEHYMESLLNLYAMTDCHPVATPLVPNQHSDTPTQAEIREFNKLTTNYKSSVGSLSCIHTATRPDISYAINTLLQFFGSPQNKVLESIYACAKVSKRNIRCVH
ncbi:hypothetical protein O181_001132 [Austropuccinia psidii MF-1]|uniref:Reverse transcriptase Ty1/copia-type domain-containing protein n=1 Tax=Austropuccinia psidii MF-1 TaxID=1389203 RepID=A0A9Q3BA80_9BASI|nr:hypothetical protein [Austropuccinia psidii MF-1]